MLGLFNHQPTEGGHTLRDLQTRQLSHLGASETVDRIGADLEGQLATIQHFLLEGVRLLLQVCLGPEMNS